MLKKLVPLFLLMFGWSMVSFADDDALPPGPGPLSGFWHGVDAKGDSIEGQYYLTDFVSTQKGRRMLCWSAEQKAEFPDWANAFCGQFFSPEIIQGNYADVPKGKYFRNYGFLRLKTDPRNPNEIIVIHQTPSDPKHPFGPAKLIRNEK